MMPPTVSPISLKPNIMGLGFIILAIAMLLAAINYGNNMIFFISFLLIALMGNSAWQTRRQLKSCSLTAQAIPPRHAADIGRWHIELSSTLTNPAIAVGLANHQPQIYAIPAASAIELALTLNPMPRGCYPSPRVSLSTHYPIGLWLATRHFDFNTLPQWIYPEAKGHAPIPAGKNSHNQPGETATSPVSDEEFDHLRRYSPGDPFNRIAFKHFAKTGQLVTQQWCSEHNHAAEIHIHFDEVGGSLETKISQITKWVLQLSTQNSPFTLSLPGQSSLNGSGEPHKHACLKALALFRAPVSAPHQGAA